MRLAPLRYPPLPARRVNDYGRGRSNGIGVPMLRPRFGRRYSAAGRLRGETHCSESTSMARTDAIVLGAGIVGTSIALHLAKRGLSRRAGRPRRSGRGDLLRQCRRHRRQYAFPPPFPAGLRRAPAGRAEARRRRPTTICRSCRRSRPGCSPIAPIRGRSGRIEFAKRSCGRCSRAPSPSTKR